jgi:hypothetical protein
LGRWGRIDGYNLANAKNIKNTSFSEIRKSFLESGQEKTLRNIKEFIPYAKNKKYR